MHKMNLNGFSIYNMKNFEFFLRWWCFAISSSSNTQKISMEAFVGRNITCMKGGKTLFAHRWIKMKRTRNLFFNQTYYT